jgi:ABC-type lipoprotein export system ATPase subunit
VQIEVIEVRDVYRTFDPENEAVHALRGASSEMQTCEFLAISRPPGCDESTLLDAIAGLDVPDEGTVDVGDDASPDWSRTS